LRLCRPNPTLADFPTSGRRGLHLISAGMTEVFSFVSLRRTTRLSRSGDVRRPVNPTAGCARSRETGIAARRVGGLEIGSDTLFIGYSATPATRAAFTEDGYFRTGDLGFTRGWRHRFLGKRGLPPPRRFFGQSLEIEQVLQQDAAVDCRGGQSRPSEVTTGGLPCGCVTVTRSMRTRCVAG
jgi:fatty-acyl-CoA synthase